MEKKYLKYTGVILIVLSFVVYGTVPFITGSSFSICMKTGLIVGVNIVSWGLFFIGGALGGKQVWNKYKGCIFKFISK